MGRRLETVATGRWHPANEPDQMQPRSVGVPPMSHSTWLKSPASESREGFNGTTVGNRRHVALASANELWQLAHGIQAKNGTLCKVCDGRDERGSTATSIPVSQILISMTDESDAGTVS